MTACRHHWLIEPPNGPTCRGRCRRCGAERDFRTSSGDEWIVPPKKDVHLIARVKREEAATTQVIYDFGHDGYLPLSAYRRNLQHVGES